MQQMETNKKKTKQMKKKKSEQELLIREQEQMIQRWYIGIPVTNDKIDEKFMFEKKMNLNVSRTH